MTERCYRLADHAETVDVIGEDARDALVAMGYGLIAEVDCDSGAITAQADESEVARAQQDREAFEALPEEEQRALRRQVGGVQIAEAGQLISW